MLIDLLVFISVALVEGWCIAALLRQARERNRRNRRNLRLRIAELQDWYDETYRGEPING